MESPSKALCLSNNTFKEGLSIIFCFPLPVLCKASHKTGKTTSLLNLGAALTAAGKRVLLADNDPQGNLTAALGFTALAASDYLSRTSADGLKEPHLPLLRTHPEHAVEYKVKEEHR